MGQPLRSPLGHPLPIPQIHRLLLPRLRHATRPFLPPARRSAHSLALQLFPSFHRPPPHHPRYPRLAKKPPLSSPHLPTRCSCLCLHSDSVVHRTKSIWDLGVHFVIISFNPDTKEELSNFSTTKLLSSSIKLSSLIFILFNSFNRIQ